MKHICALFRSTFAGAWRAAGSCARTTYYGDFAAGAETV